MLKYNNIIVASIITIFFKICFQDGMSPLHIACVNNKIDVMNVLINKGADVNVQEKVIL